MGTLSNYAEKAILDHMLLNSAYTPAATVYLGFSVADPGEDGASLSEPISGGYVRQEITFTSVGGRSVTQSADIVFPAATGGWGILTHYAIFDAPTSGNMLGSAALILPKTVVTGNEPTVLAGDVVIAITAGGMCDTYAAAAMAGMFTGVAYPQPTNVYTALLTANVTDTDTGSTIIDVIMTGYAREISNDWNASAGALALSDNSLPITFNALTGTSETILAVALVDHLTDGDVLFYCNSPNDVIAVGNTPNFPTGDFNVTLD